MCKPPRTAGRSAAPPPPPIAIRVGELVRVCGGMRLDDLPDSPNVEDRTGAPPTWTSGNSLFTAGLDKDWGVKETYSSASDVLKNYMAVSAPRPPGQLPKALGFDGIGRGKT